MVFAFWSGLSICWSLAPDATWDCLPKLAQLLIFIFLLWEFAVSYQDQLWLLRSLVLGMLVPLSMQLASLGGLSQSRCVRRRRGHAILRRRPRFKLPGGNLHGLGRHRRLPGNQFLKTGTILPLGLLGVRGGSRSGNHAHRDRAGIACLFVVDRHLRFADRRIQPARRCPWFKYIVPILFLVIILYYVVPAALTARLFEGGSADTFTKRADFWLRELSDVKLRCEAADGRGPWRVSVRNDYAVRGQDGRCDTISRCRSSSSWGSSAWSCSWSTWPRYTGQPGECHNGRSTFRWGCLPSGWSGASRPVAA